MGYVDTIQNFNAVSLAAREHGGGEIARSVIGQSRRLVKFTGIIRTGQVGQVVFHAGHFKPAVGGSHPASLGHHLLHGAHFAAPLKMRYHAARGFQRGFEDVPHFGGDVRITVVANGNIVHVADGGTGHAEHLGDGLAGKAGHMFVALAQAFLGHGGHQPAILQNTGGGIRVKGV